MYLAAVSLPDAEMRIEATCKAVNECKPDFR